MSKADTYKVGDLVETRVALPGIPAGTLGEVKEVGHLFLAIGLPNGRVGYYSPRQLRKLPPPSDKEQAE